MKTFEERYTEWIDGRLQGLALAVFEAELARRADGGDAAADKAGAARLRGLLRTHLSAPVMGNEEFFSHQLRERIAAEDAASGRRPQVRAAVPERAASSWLGWSWLRLAGAGVAASLFAAAALYYGLMPPAAVKTPMVAQNSTPAPAVQPPAPEAIPAPGPPDRGTPPGNDIQMAKNDAPMPDFQAHSADESTSATTLNYKVPNKPQSVKVLWLNGLDYSPEPPPADAPAPPVPTDPAP